MNDDDIATENIHEMPAIDTYNVEAEAFSAFLGGFSLKYRMAANTTGATADDADLQVLIETRLSQLFERRRELMEPDGHESIGVARRLEAMEIEAEIAALIFVLYERNFKRCLGSPA